MPVSQTSPASFTAPHWALTALEPARAAMEYAGLRSLDRTALPRGDGHPVVLFPGLASDRHAIGPLKAFCASLGYAAHDWGRGFNTGPQGDPDVWLDALADDVARMTAPAGEPISLVGWSLGGLYARELAKRLHGNVRQVITIGTPFAGSSEQTRAGFVYRVLNGSKPRVDAALSRRLRAAPPVPTTSIYSRSDGVVAWQACIQDGSRRDTQNIEVRGSHCGLGWNAEVFGVIADRLGQPPLGWRRYAT